MSQAVFYMRIGRIDTRFLIEGLGYFNPTFIEFLENDLDYLKVGFRNLETNELTIRIVGGDLLRIAAAECTFEGRI